MATPSAKQASKMKKKCTSLRRRQNQKAEIDELASHFHQSSTPAAEEQGTSNNKNSAIDKLSVLRLATAFLKFQNFLKETSRSNGGHISPKKELMELVEEAMDGFLIVLDKEANILYVSETILDCVGLRQYDLIGENLVERTQSSCSDEITDSLKPSLTYLSSSTENCVLSQFRQFHLIFKSTASSSRGNSYTMVKVHGNLKVKMPPLEKTGGNNGQMEYVEPSVIGFVGVCDLVESATSADDISIPNTTFSWNSDLVNKRVDWVEPSVKEVIGYNPSVFKEEGVKGIHLVHPEDLNKLLQMMGYLRKTGSLVSPHFRILNSSGDWIWIHAAVTLQGKTAIGLKCKVLSQGRNLKYIMQREIHASVPKPGQDPLNPHTFNAFVIPKPISTPRPPIAAGSNDPLSITVCQNLFVIAHHSSESINAIDPALQPSSHPQQSSNAPFSNNAANTHSQTSNSSCASSSADNAIPQTTWTSPPDPTTSNPFAHQVQHECLNRDTNSSPLPLTGFSGCSSSLQSPENSSVTPTLPQQDFLNQFQIHINQDASGECPLSNSPPNTFEMGITPQATLSTDTTTPSLFQNSHQVVPHGLHDFHPQIPVNFDFSSNTSPYYPSNNPNSSTFGLSCQQNGPLPETQTFESSFNPAIFPANSQAQNNPSAFSAMHMAPMVNWSTSMSMNLPPLHFRCGVSSSNHEAQNTFQQFI